MPTETPMKSAISLKLDNGMNDSGSMKVVGVSLGKVLYDADAAKAYAIVASLLPCLSLSPVRVERTVTSIIEAE